MLGKFQPIAIFALNAGNPQFETDIVREAGYKHFKALVGVYKGQKEKSYLVTFNGPDELTPILNLARRFKQETVLVSFEDRSSALYRTDPKKPIQYLGRFREVPETIAKQEDAYTYDPATEKYYIA